MKKIILALVLLTGSFFLNSCGSSDEGDLKAVCEKQVEAMNNEDLDGLMETIDPDARFYDVTKAMSEQIFKLYDLEQEINDFKVIEVKDNTAKIEMTITTIKKAGPDFENNRITSINTMNKKDGKWLFSETSVKELKKL
ncbi:MAG: nuclear transport factor 2 family protein [Ignavibacteriaceae bacterium]|nr:nuclear transport factor 2 family protein [Ignavibacteriaceae bacterium]NUM69509.1 nuclear transport factor 2 family protein [Ignavibacteriaceae bacterium]